MPVTRYYLLTVRREHETVYLGATSAREALTSMRFMRRDGWQINLIQRGTESVVLADVDQDAALETGTPS